MRKMLLAATAPLALLASPAAAVVIDSVDDDNIIINFVGNQPGTSATLDLDTVSIVNGVFTFNYALTNTSSGAINPQARVTGFGFTTTPDTNTGAIINGAFDNINFDGNFTGNAGFDLGVCLVNSNGNSCTGGGGGGAALNSTVNGTFSLTLPANQTFVELTNFGVRFQSLGANGEGSGIGTEVPAVPEPATWAMMLIGFGAVGYSMRRRKVSYTTARSAI